MDTQTPAEIKYFLYARKSSESEDRQVQSIQDQIDRLTELAKTLNLKVVEVLQESKSAKQPHIRPVFDSMIERIENGEANGILCWQINRLTRNPIDAGTLSWLLQQGIIQCIQTNDKKYMTQDNVLILSVDTGSANQFIIELRRNTKRGVESKLRKGWLPTSAPLGYLNTITEEQGENYILKDPERYDLVRKMWDLMLTGSYNPVQIMNIANDEWALRTRRSKRQGGTPIARSTIYRIFNNIFYAGMFIYNGQMHKGSHDAMITLDEFDRVQVLLGSKGRPRPISHEFAFASCVRCEMCGCLYVGTEKKKFIKKTQEVKTFMYYYCTRKKRHINCTERKGLKADDLEHQIEEKIEGLTILPEFRDWALEVLNQNNDKEIQERTNIYESQHKALTDSQKQLDNLTKMRYRDLITDEEYVKERANLSSQIEKLKGLLRETEQRAVNWLELTEKTFNFATYARYHFINGDKHKKKEILLALGQLPTVLGGKVTIKTNAWLQPIEEKYKAIEEEYKRLEPMKEVDITAYTEALQAVRLRWGD